MTLGIGIGLGVPGLKISVGGGIGIGSRKGGCKSHDPSKKWSQVPNAQDPSIIAIAKFAVAAFNQQHGNKLEFQAVLDAWVVVFDHKKEYSIELVARDCLHRSLHFHAVVTEIVLDGHPGWNLVSFNQIVE